MKRAIIHCGMHKTGSTSIQQSLARFRTDTLAFADLGGPNHSEAIATLFLPDPETYNGHRLKGHSRRKVLELRKTWKAQFNARMAMITALNTDFPGKSFKFPAGYITDDMIDWDALTYLRETFLIDFVQKTAQPVSGSG